jgi:hypothetical protein
MITKVTRYGSVLKFWLGLYLSVVVLLWHQLCLILRSLSYTLYGSQAVLSMLGVPTIGVPLACWPITSCLPQLTPLDL